MQRGSYLREGGDDGLRGLRSAEQVGQDDVLLQDVVVLEHADGLHHRVSSTSEKKMEKKSVKFGKTR